MSIIFYLSRIVSWVGVTAVAGLLLPVLAFADDAALYDEAPPDDALFVRWLDPTVGAVDLFGRTVQADAAYGTAYVAMSASDFLNAPKGAYLSILGANQVIAEPDRPNIGKVHLFLINDAEEPVRLIVAERGLEVVAATAPGDAASRAVNPVAAILAVERVSDGAELGRFDLRLARGQNLSFVARGGAVDLVEHRFGPVLHFNSSF